MLSPASVVKAYGDTFFHECRPERQFCSCRATGVEALAYLESEEIL